MSTIHKELTIKTKEWIVRTPKDAPNKLSSVHTLYGRFSESWFGGLQNPTRIEAKRPSSSSQVPSMGPNRDGNRFSRLVELINIIHKPLPIRRFTIGALSPKKQPPKCWWISNHSAVAATVISLRRTVTGRNVTVNGEHYRVIINYFFVAELKEVDMDDIAPGHTPNKPITSRRGHLT